MAEVSTNQINNKETSNNRSQFNSAQEIGLNRAKYQTQRNPQQAENSDQKERISDVSRDKIASNQNTSTENVMNRVKNSAKKLLKGDKDGATEDVAAVGTKLGSRYLLTTFWGSVWLDWTLLSLLYLNAHLVVSLLLPQHICQFGDDYTIGKWIPSKEMAKITEIILLMLINVIVASLILVVLFFIYALINDPTLIFKGVWIWTKAGLSGAAALVPGGQSWRQAVGSSLLNSLGN